MVVSKIEPVQPPTVSEFPRLMLTKWDDGDTMIVLFSERSTGTVVAYSGNNCHRKIGYHCLHWASVEFTPYYGKIELSNAE